MSVPLFVSKAELYTAIRTLSEAEIIPSAMLEGLRGHLRYLASPVTYSQGSWRATADNMPLGEDQDVEIEFRGPENQPRLEAIVKRAAQVLHNSSATVENDPTELCDGAVIAHRKIVRFAGMEIVGVVCDDEDDARGRALASAVIHLAACERVGRTGRETSV